MGLRIQSKVGQAGFSRFMIKRPHSMCIYSPGKPHLYSDSSRPQDNCQRKRYLHHMASNLMQQCCITGVKDRGEPQGEVKHIDHST